MKQNNTTKKPTTNNMAQTALNWFIEQLEEKGYLTEIPEIRLVEINIDTSEYLDLKRQAKEMEKAQIVKAFNEGMSNSVDYFGNGVDEAEQYYNETYNK